MVVVYICTVQLSEAITLKIEAYKNRDTSIREEGVSTTIKNLSRNPLRHKDLGRGGARRRCNSLRCIDLRVSSRHLPCQRKNNKIKENEKAREEYA
jgi:hypothetical protein